MCVLVTIEVRRLDSGVSEPPHLGGGLSFDFLWLDLSGQSRASEVVNFHSKLWRATIGSLLQQARNSIRRKDGQPVEQNHVAPHAKIAGQILRLLHSVIEGTGCRHQRRRGDDPLLGSLDNGTVNATRHSK